MSETKDRKLSEQDHMDRKNQVILKFEETLLELFLFNKQLDHVIKYVHP